MKHIRTLIFLLPGFLTIFFWNCKKDPDTFTEKLFLYYTLCPDGIDACYNDCANANGFSDGQITGTDHRGYDTCTSQCDVLCSTTFLFTAR